MIAVLVTLGLGLLSLSLVAVGGAIAVMPEVHRLTVETHGWLDDATFTQLFALAQAAPGPNVLAVSLIGWQVAGLPGLLVATVAMCGPTSLLAYAFSRLRNRLADSIWVKAVAQGLVPLAVGLMLATGIVLAEAAMVSWFSLVITAVSSIVVWRSRFSPLWVLAGGAVCGMLIQALH